MSRLFISYRRSDTLAFAQGLHAALVAKFGKPNIVFDQASIPPGVDFRDYLAQQIHECDIVLALIGPTWRDCTKEGSVRLEQEDDPVLAELEVALQRNKHLMPILIDGAPMPVERDLPSSLKPLAYKNAFRFGSESSRKSDLTTLLGAIHEYRLPKRMIRQLRWGLAVATVLAVTFGVSTERFWAATRQAKAIDGVAASLGRYDGQSFTLRDGESLKIARAFPDRDALDKASSVKDQFNNARRTFDLFVFSGKALAESETAMIEAAERGVAMRIVLIDQQPNNAVNVARYLSMLDRSGRPAEWYRVNFQSTIGILRRVRETIASRPDAKGGLSVRVFSGPFASSFWVRDSGIETLECGQVEITMYGDDRRFASVRFGQLSREVLANLSDQFSYLWGRSSDALAEANAP